MEFATVALRTLLPKLAKLVEDEYKLQKGVRKDMEFLTNELKAMHAFLHQVGEVPREELPEGRRVWAQDVRELSYDIEDIVDTFMVHLESPDDAPSKKSAIKKLKEFMGKVAKATTRHEVAQEIKDIKERVKDVAKRHQRYKVDDTLPAKKTLIDSRITALYTHVTKLVGIDETKKEVITRLTEGGDVHKKRIVSIAGFGGLGKTTLAKAVYDEIKGQLNCKHAFVSVSRDPNMKKLLENMLYELDKTEFRDIGSRNLDEQHLIDEAIEFLKNKRYLIVIDDIWDTKPWKIVECALIENNMGSRIITTTRKIDVAEQVGGCYKLKQLSDESSEKLFYGRIFGDKCPAQFSEVSKKILKKCGGVPLAIVTTSSLLANKSDNIREWYKVCDSIGLGFGSNNPDIESMTNILLLSYYDLPPHLKTCLLYLSIFPEDSKIAKDRLIWRWVAEDFVTQDQQVGDKSFLETGESYFNELVNRSLIQPADMDVDGTPQACRLHDLVLDLTISLSREECFATTVLGDGKNYSSESKQVRRLSLHKDATWLTIDMPKLRSLTIFQSSSVVIDPSRYILLRVLDLDLGSCRVKDLAIGGLSHLRYLSLASNNTDIIATDWLPDELGKKLRFLQTLDLSRTRVAVLPSSFMELKQLMCVKGGYFRVPCRGSYGFSTYCTGLPHGFKNLSALQVLKSVNLPTSIFAGELDHLSQLRVLKATVILNYGREDWGGKELLKSLGELKKIEYIDISPVHHHLAMTWDGSVEKPLGNLRRLHLSIEVVPAWITPESLPAISCLDIRVWYERKEDIHLLGTLPFLRHLKYRLVFGPKEEGMERCVVGPDAFPCMVSCEFEFGFAARGVVPSMFPPGAMPKLQDFKFDIKLDHFCSDDGFTIDDLDLAHLPSLRSVAVSVDGKSRASEQVLRSVREKLEHEAAVHPNHPHLTFI